MKHIVQWEREDDGTELICGNGMAHFSITLMEIESIIDKFQCEELTESGCLRLANNTNNPLFNHSQVDIIEKELDTLLHLDLADEERKECTALKIFLSKLPKDQREGLYLRICPMVLYECE